MKKVFRVAGMTCNSCANLIEARLKDNVKSVLARTLCLRFLVMERRMFGEKN